MGRLGPSWNVDPCFVTDDLIPRHPGINIGSSTQPFANLWVTTIHSSGSDIPTVDNVDDLGSLLFRFRNLYLGSQLRLANGQGGAVSARNVGNTAYQDLLWLDATNDTVLNAATGELIKVSVNGTAVQTISSTGVTNAGTLSFSTAAAQIIPGATSLSFRNNANSADNLIITDAGVVTIRAGVTVTAGNLTLTLGDAVLTNGSIFSATANKPWVNGLAAVPADVTAISTPQILSFAGSSGGHVAAFEVGANTTAGPEVDLFKSRATNGTADVIVQASDILGRITAYGANGTTFDPAARIEFNVDGTPGASGDMPGGITFYTSPDGTATLNQVFKLGTAGNGTFSGNVIFSQLSKGIQLQSGANGRTGTFVINGATPVVVSNTSLGAGDMIILARDIIGGTPLYFGLSARTNGTGFSITGTATDTSTCRYWLVQVN